MGRKKRVVNRCPFRSPFGNQCCHKHSNLRKLSSKHHKRICGYSKKENCQAYNDWLELKKACENASKEFVDMSEFECGVPINEALKNEG